MKLPDCGGKRAAKLYTEPGPNSDVHLSFDNKPTRPNSLSLPDHADKSIETSNESRIQRDFVEVVGADSSGTHSSPTVSSNGPNMSPSSEIASSNAEEVVTLRESMRLAIEKISHYEAILANVEASVQQKNSQNDAAKEQAILTAREECDALRSQVSNFEEQLREVRENHRRLIEEARQHRSEVQLLREERDRLEASLLEIRRKNECLQYNSPLRPAMNASSVSRSVQDDSANETERLELLPRRLVTVRLSPKSSPLLGLLTDRNPSYGAAVCSNILLRQQDVSPFPVQAPLHLCVWCPVALFAINTSCSLSTWCPAWLSIFASLPPPFQPRSYLFVVVGHEGLFYAATPPAQLHRRRQDVHI
ncbi:unnamed protein product [Schistocephalus solidus]|uniref:Uncharacterized protein n=1 Tax=Schistocephalus solidus TaxID=70667 RepID=A0A183STR1_SCHSO|nr:unnamed protein product [Schistocephalus solidus]